MERSSWSSRSTFILAAVGSAVGLGNAWRFPGLVAKHGGGAFLFVYLIAMVCLGIPLLMMEISIGRKMRSGAPGALRGINKKAEWIGWAATSNAFIIACYYAVVFAWVILMVFMSYKFAAFTNLPDMSERLNAAKNLWAQTIQTTGTVTGWSTISIPVIICLLIAWGLIYYCIRNSAHSVGKVIKYIVFMPIIILVIMAIKGLSMDGAMEGIKRLFIPDFNALTSPGIWVDAFGQVFYSMSVMMAIMFAYGSYLSDDSNIAVDGLIIAFSDIAVSLLAGVVMFSTMGGTGMLDNMSASGVSTAFMIYPQTIVSLTNVGWFNALFGVLFYLCLVTLAIDSAFSIVEGVSSAISDKFGFQLKKTTIGVCIAAGIISLVFTTGAGMAYVDIVDNWTNQYNMVIVGVVECIAVGYMFKTSKVLHEVNRNTGKIKMPSWWFNAAIKVIAPLLLTILVCWNLGSLFTSGGIYGAADGYTLASNIWAGWIITILAFLSGAIVRIIVKRNKKFREREENFKAWED